METRIKLCYSFFFIIFNLSRIVEGGDNSLMNDDLRGVLYKTEDDMENKIYENRNEYYNACTYNNGKDPNIRKNIEDIIKVLVKDSLPLAMETLDEQEHDIASDIQVAANKIIIQLALHASNITRKILQSMEKPNDSQVVVDTEMHNELIVYQNQIEELEDKISLLSNKTKELTDTINVNNKQQSESMASLNNKIVILNNLTDTINVNNKQQSESMASLNNKIVILNNLTDTINVNNKQQSESMASLNNKIAQLENLTSTDSQEHKDMLGTIEKIQNSVMNLSETFQKLEEKLNATKVTSFCDVIVPAAIVPNPNIWKYRQIPEKDDLDTYLINKTGCSYLALGYGKEHALAAGPLPGQLEWRVAVRAPEWARMRLGWGSVDKYAFWVGGYNNTKSGLNDHVHGQSPVRATPGVLAEDRYVPLYLKIANGKLTAGAECEPEPWFTADFTRKEGELIQRSVYSGSHYAAKLLYDCPASFTGQ